MCIATQARRARLCYHDAPSLRELGSRRRSRRAVAVAANRPQARRARRRGAFVAQRGREAFRCAAMMWIALLQMRNRPSKQLRIEGVQDRHDVSATHLMSQSNVAVTGLMGITLCDSYTHSRSRVTLQISYRAAHPECLAYVLPVRYTRQSHRHRAVALDVRPRAGPRSHLAGRPVTSSASAEDETCERPRTWTRQ